MNLYKAVGTWRDLTVAIHRRDKVCRLCGGAGLRRGTQMREFTDAAGVFRPAHTTLVSEFHVDHILTVKDGGTDDPANLRLLCIPCHKLITALWLFGRRARNQKQRALL